VERRQQGYPADRRSEAAPRGWWCDFRAELEAETRRPEHPPKTHRRRAARIPLRLKVSLTPFARQSRGGWYVQEFAHMTREIDGFAVNPYDTDTITVQRVAEPQHAYLFRYTWDGVELLETVPGATTQGDRWNENAKHHVSAATETAKKYKAQLIFAAAEAAE
jgi:hypothetical protein